MIVESDRARDDSRRLRVVDSTPSPGTASSAESSPAPVHEVLTFREVYDRYFAFVWRSCANRGVRQAALDDVVQEVFIVVHRKLPEFQGRSTMRTWVAAIVRWVVADYVRKRGNQPAGEQLPEHAVSASAMPSDELERKDAALLLEALLSKMSEEQREVFVLHELEHMSGIEIAEITGVNENTVWSRVRAARKIFQEGVARHKARGSREQA